MSVITSPEYKIIRSLKGNTESTSGEVNFSIIIPHKNIPSLLKRCIDSIPKRKDLEIIIVDDDSDNIDYSTFPGIDNFNTTIIFTTQSLGAGFARNVGLKYAQGKWLIFADADDFFTPIFTKVLDKHRNNNADIIYFTIESRDCETLQLCERGIFVNKTIKKALQTNNDNILRFQRLEPWGKLIKRHFIMENHIQFDQTLAGNDLMFSVLSGFYAKNIEAYDEPIYCLTQRSGSLAYSINQAICDAKCNVISNVNKFLISKNLATYRINIYPYIIQYAKIDCLLLIKKIMWSFTSYGIRFTIWDFVKSSFKALTK